MIRLRSYALLSAGVVCLLAGCAYRRQSTIVADEAQGLPEPDHAIVELSPIGATVVSIEQGGKPVYTPQTTISVGDIGQRDIRLKPGVYTIFYSCDCYEIGRLGKTFDFELKAGHTYGPRKQCCYWWSPEHGCSFWWGMAWQANQRRGFAWFEDVTTGEVIDGSKTVPAMEPSPY